MSKECEQINVYDWPESVHKMYNELLLVFQQLNVGDIETAGKAGKDSGAKMVISLKGCFRGLWT